MTFSRPCVISRKKLRVSYQSNQMLLDVGIDGEVCIQRVLKLTNVGLGC